MSHRFTSPVGYGALAALASLATLVACGGSDATKPGESANVRIVNVSPTIGAITANAEGRTVQSGVTFQASSQTGGCGTVEKGGDEEISFVNAGTSNGLGSIKYNFVAQQSYTVLFYNTNDAVVYPESFSLPTSGNNALRFINATAAAGDIYVTAGNVTNVSGAPTIANLASRAASGSTATLPGGTFAQYPTSNTRVRVFAPGTQTNPRLDFTVFGIPANGVATVILTLPGQNNQQMMMVGACSG